MSATEHKVHADHGHTHGQGCGHQTVEHEGHLDYLHDGHLHYVHEECVDDHLLSVDAANMADCAPGHACEGHEKAHAHGADCGHAQVPHGDHVDHLVGDHLHYAHADHCDTHGTVRTG